MIEPLNIVEQIKISVSLAEGQFREFKTGQMGPPGQKTARSVKDICKDVGEALVAFANADGGELIIGVEDDGELTGCNDFSVGEIACVKEAVRTHIHKDTPLQSVISRDVEIDGFRLIYFRVAKSTRFVHLTSDGRCLRRNDLETIPVAVEKITFDRQEIKSREYDREFVDGASTKDLDEELLRIVSDQISPGISIDRCLQYLGLAEYDGITGLRLRRAAVILFAKSCEQWHPRVQVRILRVDGTGVGSGPTYNIKSDSTVKTNIVRLIDDAWENLRPHLVTTRFQEDARFRSTYIYPEIACREALVNAIAHRDYSEEGRGIEIYIFDDRIEVRNPGALLSSISISDITALRGVHQSRNSYVARTLREIGIMRELGEGMRRIYQLMKTNELAEPEIKNENNSFNLVLHHKAMYSRDEILWLSQYDSFNLPSDAKAVLLMGRRGDLIAPNDIITRLGIVDIEQYRLVLDSLQKLNLLVSAVSKASATRSSKKAGCGVRDIPRFKIRTYQESLARDKVAVDKSQSTSRKALHLDKKLSIAASEVAVRKVYVGNIPPNTTSRDVSAAFSDVGAIQNISIPQKNGLSRGYAVIEFASEKDALAAIASEVQIGGRKIIIRWDQIKSRR